MKLHFEKEFKILLTKEQFVTLLKQYPQAQFKKQVNTYYDTEDLFIRKQIGAMRIREIDHHFIFTLKQRHQDGAQEFECEVNENSLKAFDSEELRSLFASLHIDHAIIELTTLTTYRALIPLPDGELCFDYNEYNGICDFELEYEFLHDHDGLTVFNDILKPVNLRYKKNCMAKIQRALISSGKVI